MCTSTHYFLHNYKVSGNSVKWFQRSCTDKLFGVVSIILAKISKLKKGVTPRKKMNKNFLWMCTSTWYVLHNHKVTRNYVEWFQRRCAVLQNYKVSRYSVEQFQRSCADKKNRTDGLTDWLTDRLTNWLTDWLTDESKTFYPPQLVAWGIIWLRNFMHARKTFRHLLKSNKKGMNN